MIYNLLKRIQNLLASKPSGTKEEQEILSLVSQALPAMLNGHDTETLAANELLVRICPDTKRPVLVCHNGNGQCLCLHNGTTEEDAVDVDLWLHSNGRECNGYNKVAGGCRGPCLQCRGGQPVGGQGLPCRQCRDRPVGGRIRD